MYIIFLFFNFYYSIFYKNEYNNYTTIFQFILNPIFQFNFNLVYLSLLIIFFFKYTNKYNLYIYILLFFCCLFYFNLWDYCLSYKNQLWNSFFLNTKFSNGLVNIHPLSLYVFYVLIGTLIINKIKNNQIFLLKKIFFFLFFSISLGAWWAEQELGWNFWWSWDFIEIITLFFLLLLINGFHNLISNKSNLLYLYKKNFLFYIFLFILCVRLNIFSSLHNFADNLFIHYYYYFFCVIIFFFFFFFFKLKKKKFFFSFKKFDGFFFFTTIFIYLLIYYLLILYLQLHVFIYLAWVEKKLLNLTTSIISFIIFYFYIFSLIYFLNFFKNCFWISIIFIFSFFEVLIFNIYYSKITNKLHTLLILFIAFTYIYKCFFIFLYNFPSTYIYLKSYFFNFNNIFINHLFSFENIIFQKIYINNIFKINDFIFIFDDLFSDFLYLWNFKQFLKFIEFAYIFYDYIICFILSVFILFLKKFFKKEIYFHFF